METFQWLITFTRTARSLVAGLLLAGLFGGCGTTPLVNVAVQVDTCPSGSSRSPLPGGGLPGGGLGACSLNPANPYVGPLIPANTTPNPPYPYKVCKDATNKIVSCTGNEQCTGGRVCNDPPGSENRKTCKSVWTQSAAGSTNGNCACTSDY